MTDTASPAGTPAESRRNRIDTAFDAEQLAGTRLAMIARLVAVAIIGVWLVVLLEFEAVYYLACITLFGANGVAQYVIARRRPARRWPTYLIVAVDVALLTFLLVVQNPLAAHQYPAAFPYRFDNFVYFFVVLAGVALSFSPGVMLWAGVAGGAFWLVGLAWVASHPETILLPVNGVPDGASRAEAMALMLDPHTVLVGQRVQEVIVLLLVAGTLAAAVRRARRLAHRQAEVERERSNLARYFPPSMVDRLSHADRPLGEGREQTVAVLFADVVGFTRLAEQATPQQVVEGLRALHRRLEACVFDNHGTLDKFLGDGVMATFGTPDPGPSDAANALACARAMQAAVDEWNGRRRDAGLPPIRLSVGVHWGRVVLGDIGSERRLEFTVLGDTVNVAARIEALTRVLGCRVAASEALVDVLRASGDPRAASLLDGFREAGPQILQGRAEPVAVWTWGTPVPQASS